MKKYSKCRVNFEFELRLEELVIPLNIRSKLPTNSSFFVVWKRGHDEPIESRAVSMSPGKGKEEEKNRFLWSLEEPEDLNLKCVLIKLKQSEEYMSKQCRFLLKQMHGENQHQSTVGAAKLDLKDYVLCKEPTPVEIHFSKCNIANIYLKAMITSTLIDDESNKSDEDDNMSVASARTIDVEQMNLDLDDSSPPDNCSPLVDDLLVQPQKQNNVDNSDGSNRNNGYVTLSSDNLRAFQLNEKEKKQYLNLNSLTNKNTSSSEENNDQAEETRPRSVSFTGFSIKRNHTTSASTQSQLLADLTRQCAQLEAKLKIEQDENEELKTELQELTDKYDALLSKDKEMERELKTQEMFNEKERHMLKTQLSEAQEKLTNSFTEMKSVKAENAAMQEQISQNIKKYNEILKTLTAGKKKKPIAS